MSELLYVPVLRARPHAAKAYAWQSPIGRRRIAPLWNLPPRPEIDAPALTAGFRKDLGSVGVVHRHSDGWIDAPFADETQMTVLADLLDERCMYARLRPVTGPDRSAFQQATSIETAARSHRGLGIRVPVEGEWDDGTREAVRSLVARADPGVRVDLLLDMGAVLASRPDAGKEALRALDALFPLASWREVCVLSAGFPHVTVDMLEQGLREEPRWDWAMWHEIAQSRRPYLAVVRYGDYGTQSAHAIAQPPSDPKRKGGPDWGFLRYTTERDFVISKVLHTGRRTSDKLAFNRAAARRIVELPSFRGTGAGAAETWLLDLAGGGDSTGAFGDWLTVGNAQHMAYVAHALRSQ
ncbi:hypothetical protein [Streptomyces sp. NPDC051921]|uniref:beta family protein n=1 Tax=Streptomyces sp. NPDC051921 TaxID=3155806 RepID=UPI00341B9E79